MRLSIRVVRVIGVDVDGDEDLVGKSTWKHQIFEGLKQAATESDRATQCGSQEHPSLTCLCLCLCHQ